MKFNPKTTHPTPDPFYSRELKKIDPDLRVVWGFERYLQNRWVIERRIPADRYWLMYQSLFESDGQRFIEQPIFDVDDPILDENGNQIGWAQVGTRRYDLAPEYEWVMTIQTPDGQYKQFEQDTILEVKRMYAWHYNQPFSRLKWEQEELAKQESAQRAENALKDDIFVEGYDQARREAGVKVQVGGGD